MTVKKRCKGVYNVKGEGESFYVSKRTSGWNVERWHNILGVIALEGCFPTMRDALAHVQQITTRHTTSEQIQRAEYLEELADDLREKADDAPHIFNDMAERADRAAKSARAEVS